MLTWLSGFVNLAALRFRGVLCCWVVRYFLVVSGFARVGVDCRCLGVGV